MSDEQFTICENCRANSGVMQRYSLCCATRSVMDSRHPPKVRQQEAARIGKAFGHSDDDMRTMAGELRAYWTKEGLAKAGAPR